jgi:hypothetical protein
MSLLGDIGAFANPFGAPSAGQWNLARGIYTNGDGDSVVFFYETKDPSPTQRTGIEQVTDSGGRRLAKYEYPYKDGQRIRDLGRKGENIILNIKFWGTNYQAKFDEFLVVVINSGTQGTLVHPVRGAMTVRFETYEFLHQYTEWNAITIKATFSEDALDQDLDTNVNEPSVDSALRSSLQALTTLQASISNAISDVSAILLLPGAIVNAMEARLTSITGQMSRLLGQLGVTFSSNSTIQNLAAAAAPLAGGVTDLTSGTVVQTTSGQNQMAKLPPVFQVGFDATTQAVISSQISAYVSANQITPQQAVFAANQLRVAIAAAITEVNTNFGNYGYDVMLQYRQLAVSIQQAVEASLSSSVVFVKLYTVPYPMSLRAIAFANGLTPDRGNDIEALNPYLPSVNYVPAGTQVTVPVS